MEPVANTRTTPTFRQRVERLAVASLKEAVPAAEVARAAAQVALAFGAAHRAARDPSALDACTDASIGACIALSALTGLMPGGSHALVYLVPQAARKGEPPELQWRPTHRAYAALALEESGIMLMPVAVHVSDPIEISMGLVTAHTPSGEPILTPDDLAGVYIHLIREGRDLACPWVPASTIQRIRTRSRAGDSGPWATDYEAMAMAAAIRWLHGRGAIPSSSRRLQMAAGADSDADREQTTAEVAVERTRSRQRQIQVPVESPEVAEREPARIHADEGGI